MHYSEKEHFWFDTNPFVVRNIPHMMQFSLNVWCGLSRNHLRGLILYDGALKGDRYVNEILNMVISKLTVWLPLTSICFVVTGRISSSLKTDERLVKDCINNEFPDKDSGLHGSVEFSSISTDVISVTFYLYNSLPTAVYLSQLLNK